MKEIYRELLSRILDEDITELDMQRILKEMQSRPELRSTLQRYNLIGHAMRKQIPARLNQCFANEVMQKLSNEAEFNAGAIVSKQIKPSTGKIKSVIGLAIAASIAVASLVVFENFMQPDINTEAIPVVAEHIDTQNPRQHVNATEAQSFISNPKAAAGFDSYLVNHVEYASPRVSIPHVRIVSYEREQNNR